jgi:hypothetical protein
MDTADRPSASASAMAATTIASRLWVGTGPRVPRSRLVQIGWRLPPPTAEFGDASFTDQL